MFWKDQIKCRSTMFTKKNVFTHYINYILIIYVQIYRRRPRNLTSKRAALKVFLLSIVDSAPASAFHKSLCSTPLSDIAFWSSSWSYHLSSQLSGYYSPLGCSRSIHFTCYFIIFWGFTYFARQTIYPGNFNLYSLFPNGVF